ncbi:hypothetical protein M422DRAFT_56087, partial [Sphaerobolus stellatus SS14]
MFRRCPLTGFAYGQIDEVVDPAEKQVKGEADNKEEKEYENSRSSSDEPVATRLVQVPKRSTLNATLIILVCLFGMVTTSYSNQSANIALPSIARDLNINQDIVQWVSSALALSS